MWRVVAVGMAVGAGTAIIPYGSASAAPDGDAPASDTSIPRGTTISYDGDDAAVLIGKPFPLSITGSNYFGLGGDDARGLPVTLLEPSGRGDSSPGDFLTGIVGKDWLH
jgi:hypothetical protein